MKRITVEAALQATKWQWDWVQENKKDIMAVLDKQLEADKQAVKEWLVSPENVEMVAKDMYNRRVTPGFQWENERDWYREIKSVEAKSLLAKLAENVK